MIADANKIEELVGQLFGNLLLRDADKDGFEHYCETLTNGGQLKEAVIAIVLSDEFVERFLYNDTPNEIARKFITSFLGKKSATPAFVKSCAQIFIDKGLEALVRKLSADARYKTENGSGKVPNYGAA